MIKSIIRYIFWERDENSTSYTDELHYQCSRVLPLASFLCCFIWLGYIKVDSQLTPGEPLIVTMRIGLTVVSLTVFLLQFLPALRKKSMYLLAALGLYLEAATGIITGLAKGDHVYMGGYMFVLIIPIIAPMRKYFIWFIMTVSLAFFFAIGYSKGMQSVTIRDAYVMNDLRATILFAFSMVFVLDRIRYQNWQKSRKIEDNKKAIQKDKERIDSIVSESRSVIGHVMEASNMLHSSSSELKETLGELSNVVSGSMEIGESLVSSFEKVKKDVSDHLAMNREGHDLTERLRLELAKTGTTGEKARKDATKAKELSDDCENKLSNAIKSIDRLREESSRIEEISGTINDIADQTNLLSLNASIESARAGEAGRGFAVVSEEISKLADKSMQSAKEIGQIIKNSVRMINDSSYQMEQTSTSLTEIIAFLETNRSFIEQLESMIKSQDTDVQSLIGYLESSLVFTQHMDSLADESTTNTEQSLKLTWKTGDYYKMLTAMSVKLQEISEGLNNHTTNLEKTLMQP